MRILVHDYSGHPFQVQLSRSLAARGHEVLHLYSASIPCPKATLNRRVSDPPGFQVQALTLSQEVAKYNYFRRFAQEWAYAGLLQRATMAYAPSIVVCSNTPIDIMMRLAHLCNRRSVPWIYWLQDFYSIAIEKYFGDKVPAFGPLVSRYYSRKESWLFGSASVVVAISESYLSLIEHLGGNLSNVSVVENWAPLDEISPRQRNNPWSMSNNLDASFCFLYAGTLGRKHNPDRLLELARRYRQNPNVRVVVVSEGLGASYISKGKQRFQLENLKLFPWQPFEHLPNVLATADVLLAILEPDAGVLSVPSKILTNLAAGRPQLLCVPPENLAARTVTKAHAGLVAAPDDEEMWTRHAARLLQDVTLRREMGQNAWNYARDAFNIDRITDRFEEMMHQCGT